MGVRNGLFLASFLAIVPIARGAVPLDSADAVASSTFSITHQTQIPGEVLKPGDYSIQIVEHISDRMIVRIDGAQGNEHVLFLGVPTQDANASNGAPGVQTWHTGAGSLPTLRGFNFPSGTAIDFVYPKAEAAALAKANAATIIAVDPESEGRPSKLKNLSSDDMREINLWMLTLTSTGPDSNKVPALEAKRYEPRSSTGTEIAAAPQAVAVRQPTAGANDQSSQVAKLDRPEPPQAKAAKRKPVVAVLPHTASLLPVVELLGLASFFGAVTLFIFRKLFRSASLSL